MAMLQSQLTHMLATSAAPLAVRRFELQKLPCLAPARHSLIAADPQPSIALWRIGLP
jgi:hypothetical protein